MSNKISLRGLDKAEVFAALYNAARPQGLGFLQYDPEPMTAEKAKELFGENFGYFDYVNGRVMKVDLSGDELDPWLYDRDNGQGTAERVILAVRFGNVNSTEIKTMHQRGVRKAIQDAEEHLDEETIIDNDKGVIRLGLSEFADQLKHIFDDLK